MGVFILSMWIQESEFNFWFLSTKQDAEKKFHLLLYCIGMYSFELPL